MTTVTSHIRIKSDKPEEMIKIAKAWKKVVEKHGAEWLRLSRFQTGPWIGDWNVVVRFPSWEAFGKAQGGMAKDSAWAKVVADSTKVAQVMDRHITAGIDL